MKGPRPLIEQNELFASLVDDAHKREPSDEALQKVLDILDSPAAAPVPPARARLRAPNPWICLAVVGAGALAVLGYSTLERPHQETAAVGATAAATIGKRIAEPAPEAVPSMPISDLPDSKDAPPRGRPVAARPSASQGSSSAASPAPAAKPSTARELELITRAREAVTKGDARACLAAVAQHDAEFPDGQFTPEAAVMRIEATYASGDRAGARTLARAFLAKHPGSPYVARIRSLAAASEKE
ncbi:MAG: hypothetical protein K0S65_4613 [Labilithrix sp.]|nr:hypothetical protein [Labilithrix sp.]